MHTHFWDFPRKIFYLPKISPHLFGITKPNDTLFHRKNEKIFFGCGCFILLAPNPPSLIPTGRSQMHTLNLKKFFIPSLIWNWEAETHPVFTKMLKNIFSIESLDSACSKSPLTYSHWEQPNAPPKSQKNFIPSLIWNWNAKTQPVFQKKQKNFFEKTVCLKSIPSPVPAWKGIMRTVILKKGKKICPPDMAGRDITVKVMPTK